MTVERSKGRCFLTLTFIVKSLLLELKLQHPGYEVQQCNIIIDALGGWSKDVEETMKKLVGAWSKCVLGKICAAYSPLFQSNCFISWNILFLDDEQLTFYYCF